MNFEFIILNVNTGRWRLDMGSCNFY